MEAPTKFALKYGYRYGMIPTFQHNDNDDWKTLILNTTKTGQLSIHAEELIGA